MSTLTPNDTSSTAGEDEPRTAAAAPALPPPPQFVTDPSGAVMASPYVDTAEGSPHPPVSTDTAEGPPQPPVSTAVSHSLELSPPEPIAETVQESIDNQEIPVDREEYYPGAPLPYCDCHETAEQLRQMNVQWLDFKKIFDDIIQRQPMASTNELLNKNIAISQELKSIIQGFQSDQQRYTQWLMDMEKHFQKLHNDARAVHTDIFTAYNNWSQEADNKIREIKTAADSFAKATKPLEDIQKFLNSVQATARSLNLPVNVTTAASVATSSGPPPAPAPGFPSSEPPQSSLKRKNKKTLRCMLCNTEDHSTKECHVYTTYRQRTDRATAASICMKCLQHFTPDATGEHSNCRRALLPCPHCRSNNVDPLKARHSPIFCPLQADPPPVGTYPQPVGTCPLPAGTPSTSSEPARKRRRKRTGPRSKKTENQPEVLAQQPPAPPKLQPEDLAQQPPAPPKFHFFG
ncbi:hypothetical protein B9Z55_028236 [Caenorhabditis nigoni]|uniref:Nanos-type domain-containing protein n=1 Tax=Caenorhabditis nigoni TaxID=1611254 RepID=A0A2G5SCW2_9PELO|nr:hypothetical protein B9Z55_028236 [Caenorhabditis nigoni]